MHKNKEIENTHAMMQALIQVAIEAMKAVVKVMSEAAASTKRNIAAVTSPSTSIRGGRPALKQMTCNCETHDKYKTD